MSNVFKLCPTYFPGGAKNFLGGDSRPESPGYAPACTLLFLPRYCVFIVVVMLLITPFISLYVFIEEEINFDMQVPSARPFELNALSSSLIYLLQ